MLSVIIRKIFYCRVRPNMADRCRIVIEAVLKYAQELLSSNTNMSLPADLKVSILPKRYLEKYFSILSDVTVVMCDTFGDLLVLCFLRMYFRMVM